MTFAARTLQGASGFSPVLRTYAAATTVSPATTAASGTGTTATITFAAQTIAPPVGSLCVILGVAPSLYNGTYVVTASSTTSVSYACIQTGVQTVAGTATVATQVTETAPAGASNVVIECWGAAAGGGGAGQHGKTGGINDSGGGGGSGGYSRTSIAVTSGQTTVYIVGKGSPAGGDNTSVGGIVPGGPTISGGLSKVSSGTLTITGMTGPAGGAGGNANPAGSIVGGAAGAAGATGTGGTAANSVGNAGTGGTAVSPVGGAGATGVTGVNGVNGGNGGVGGVGGAAGADGKIAYYYT